MAYRLLSTEGKWLSKYLMQLMEKPEAKVKEFKIMDIIKRSF